MIKLSPGQFEWKPGKTRMRGRFMIGHCLMNVVAIKVQIISNAFVQTMHADDDFYLRRAHDLMESPGMPETINMYGGEWVVLAFPSAETV